MGDSPSASRSHTDSTCGAGPADSVAAYRASGDRSRAATPSGCGARMDLIGSAEYESHSTSMESGPASALTSRRRSSDAAVAEMALQ